MTLGSRGSAQGWALGLGEGAPAFSGRSGASLLCPSQDFSRTPGLEVETEQPSPLSADPGSGCPGGGTGLPAVLWAQGYGGEREGTSGPAGRWAGLRKGLGRVRVSRAPGAALGARDREEPAQPGGQTPTPHPRSIPSWSPNPQPPHIAHSLLSPAKPPSVAMATGAEKAGGAGCFPLFPAPSAGRGLRAGRRLQPPPASEPPPPRQAWPQPRCPVPRPTRRPGEASPPLQPPGPLPGHTRVPAPPGALSRPGAWLLAVPLEPAPLVSTRSPRPPRPPGGGHHASPPAARPWARGAAACAEATTVGAAGRGPHVPATGPGPRFSFSLCPEPWLAPDPKPSFPVAPSRSCCPSPHGGLRLDTSTRCRGLLPAPSRSAPAGHCPYPQSALSGLSHTHTPTRHTGSSDSERPPPRG